MTAKLSPPLSRHGVLSRAGSILREATASAWGSPAASIITIVMLAGMVATVLLTTGRTAGAEQAVVSTIDSAGTRSIVVRADGAAGLNSDVLDRLALLDGVEWAGAFSNAFDTVNAANEDGIRVPARFAYSATFDIFDIPEQSAFPDTAAYASPAALTEYGMVGNSGGARSLTGQDFPVMGSITVPDFLDFLQPLVVVPQLDDTDPAPVNILVVIAARPELVVPVAQATVSLLGVDDPSKVSVETSAQLAQLRALVEGQLASFSRGLVLVIVALTALLVAAILYGLVILRRKDFGRRRALGANRALIVTLLLAQTGLLATVGAVLGAAGAAIALAAAGDPLPSIGFFASIMVLATTTGLIAAIIPAIVASHRDPLRELRVP